MLNEIIKGISIKLNAAFGDGFKIYQNDVEQGLQEPCFFIRILKPELSPLLGRRSMKRNPFDVLYFPSNPGNNAELISVAEKMMESLEFITIPNGDVLRATGISYEIQDDVLHFFVSFNHTQIRPGEELPKMETLDVDIDTQKG